MEYRNFILQKLKEENLKLKKLKNGTLLYSYDTKGTDIQYEFSLFHPLAEEEITSLKNGIVSIPESYVEFLRDFNGIYLFDGEHFLYGQAFLEKGMTWEEQIYQPYDLIEENEDPPFTIKKDYFYFGGTPTSIYLMEKKGQILEFSKRNKKRIKEFENLDSLIVSIFN